MVADPIKPSNAVLVRNISGFYISIDASGRVATDTSVSITTVSISGGPVTISGGYINISGGSLGVTVSGGGVTISGGNIVVTSGTGVRVSGETVVIAKGGVTITDIEDNPVDIETQSQLLGYDNTADNWARLRITTSGSVGSNSGITFRLLTDTVEHGGKLRTGAFVSATSGSGGVVLTTNGGIAPYGVSIKNIGGIVPGGVSGLIYVGSSGNPPYASGGYVLATNSEMNLKVDMPDYVRVYATMSGVQVSWCTVDF